MHVLQQAAAELTLELQEVAAIPPIQTWMVPLGEACMEILGDLPPILVLTGQS